MLINFIFSKIEILCSNVCSRCFVLFLQVIQIDIENFSFDLIILKLFSSLCIILLLNIVLTMDVPFSRLILEL